MAPGGRNLDLTCATLPELPDISAIRLDSVGHENRSGDTTVLSSVSEKDSTVSEIHVQLYILYIYISLKCSSREVPLRKIV